MQAVSKSFPPGNNLCDNSCGVIEDDSLSTAYLYLKTQISFAHLRGDTEVFVSLGNLDSKSVDSFAKYLTSDGYKGETLEQKTYTPLEVQRNIIFRVRVQ